MDTRAILPGGAVAADEACVRSALRPRAGCVVESVALPVPGILWGTKFAKDADSGLFGLSYGGRVSEHVVFDAFLTSFTDIVHL